MSTLQVCASGGFVLCDLPQISPPLQQPLPHAVVVNKTLSLNSQKHLLSDMQVAAETQQCIAHQAGANPRLTGFSSEQLHINTSVVASEADCQFSFRLIGTM